jgi:hypothetical protein
MDLLFNRFSASQIYILVYQMPPRLASDLSFPPLLCAADHYQAYRSPLFPHCANQLKIVVFEWWIKLKADWLVDGFSDNRHE